MSSCIECRQSSLEADRPMGIIKSLSLQIVAVDRCRRFSADRGLCFENHQPLGFLCVAGGSFHPHLSTFLSKEVQRQLKFPHNRESRHEVSKH